jgi:hypothetical protein
MTVVETINGAAAVAVKPGSMTAEGDKITKRYVVEFKKFGAS